MSKKIKIPVYNQLLIIDDKFEDADRYAITETPPLTLRYNKDSWCITVLAHECIHVVDFLLSNIGQGMPKRDETGYFDDEYYSYLYAAIFDLIFKNTKQHLKEFNNVNRRKRTKKMLQHRCKKTDREES